MSHLTTRWTLSWDFTLTNMLIITPLKLRTKKRCTISWLTSNYGSAPSFNHFFRPLPSTTSLNHFLQPLPLTASFNPFLAYLQQHGTALGLTALSSTTIEYPRWVNDESVKDLFGNIKCFFEAYPLASEQLLAAEDMAYLLAILQRLGQKPVPFIPVLDASFEVWVKKVSSDM